MIIYKITVKEMKNGEVSVQMQAKDRFSSDSEKWVGHILNNVVRRAAQIEASGNNLKKVEEKS